MSNFSDKALHNNPQLQAIDDALNSGDKEVAKAVVREVSAQADAEALNRDNVKVAQATEIVVRSADRTPPASA
jgi:hypothetical protein